MKKYFKIIILLVLSLSINGCFALNRNYVAYTVYPIGFILERIGQNRINAISIQENKPVQISSPVEEYKNILKDSQYFFHIGDLEPYYHIYQEDFVASGTKIVDLSSLNAIYNFKRYSLLFIDGKETFVEGDYYNGDEFKNIDTPDKDLFLWLDPISMISMAKDVVNTLASNYVEESDFFYKNYHKLEEELINLDANYQKLSNKLKKENKTVKFVSMTNSFGNWQKAYGFQVYPISLSKYGTLPNKAQLEQIKKRIIEDGVKYIAYEPNMDLKMQTLFNELETSLNLTRVNLSNLSSLTETQITDNKDYMSIMYENLTVLENMAIDNIDATIASKTQENKATENRNTEKTEETQKETTTNEASLSTTGEQ